MQSGLSGLSRDFSPKELGIWLSLPKPQSPECRDIRRRKQPRHMGKSWTEQPWKSWKVQTHTTHTTLFQHCGCLDPCIICVVGSPTTTPQSKESKNKALNGRCSLQMLGGLGSRRKHVSLGTFPTLLSVRARRRRLQSNII